MCNRFVLILYFIYILFVNTVSAIGVSIEDEEHNLVVRTTTGLVRGKYAGTIGLNRSYYYFGGIPYAEPPVGQLRFEAPVPKKSWKGVFEAIQNGPECLQGSNPVRGSENCLYIQIFTTQLSSRNEQKLPVMIFIHGGMFIEGSANFSQQRPDFLLNQDVIVAALHYRLGIFGFLTTGDMVVPGNNGLKDQILALRWIKDNIDAFGGDPDNITIFGQSAGAVSISYLIQSHLTKGLFNRAILHSGVSLCLWAYFRKGTEFFRKLAWYLGIPSYSSLKMVEGLRSIDAETLQKSQMSLYKLMLLTSNPRDGVIMGPVLEPDHEEAIFSERSYSALQKGEFNHVPLIIGYTSLEAYLSEISDFFRIWLLNYDTQNSKLVPLDINVKNPFTLIFIGDMIKEEYFGKHLISLSSHQLMEFISDDQFERPIQETVRLYSTNAIKAPVYYYRFSYEGSLWGVINRTSSGVGHTEDLGYLFSFNQSGSNEDYLTRDRMVKLWTNFAKTGNPTPLEDTLLQNITWTPNIGNSEDISCLDIDSDLRMIKSPNRHRMKFWKDLYEKYAVPPLDTF